MFLLSQPVYWLDCLVYMMGPYAWKSILRKEIFNYSGLHFQSDGMCCQRKRKKEEEKRLFRSSRLWPLARHGSRREDCESSCHGGEHEMSMGEEKNCSLEMQTTDHLIFLLSMATHKNGKG